MACPSIDWWASCNARPGEISLNGCFGAVSGTSADGTGHAEFDVTVARTLPLAFEAPLDCAAVPDSCQLMVIDQSYTPIDHVVINFRAVVVTATDPPPPSTDSTPSTDPTPSTASPEVEVLPAVETHPLFTG